MSGYGTLRTDPIIYWDAAIKEPSNKNSPNSDFKMITTPDTKEYQDFLTNLQKVGIYATPDQDETNMYGYDGEIIGTRKLDNMVFTKNDKSIKVANTIIFHHHGIASIWENMYSNKKGEENYVKVRPITNKEYYQMQFDLIVYRLNLKK